MSHDVQPNGLSRRDFIKLGTACAGGFALGTASAAAVVSPSPAISTSASPTRPNFIFIICDQLSLNAIAAHGCRWAQTPNIDRLVARGVTFMESHSTNPVCSPARSSLFTGRMPVETGVIVNNLAVVPGIPCMGSWFKEHGYETAYCGKWHVPGASPDPARDGFTVLPQLGAQGNLKDGHISRTCAAWLGNRRGREPFVLVASFLQPHDICYWAIQRDQLVPEDPVLPFAHLRDALPELPPNNGVRPKAPAALDRIRQQFSPEQWRYYLYNYYRMVEMLDADVGRLLDGLEDAGLADETIVIFTSDHGEGGGRHDHVQKWYPYEESVKVPLIVSCPARLESGARDERHLVSGLDVMSTMCDYAGIPAPPNVRGLSLRPLLEGKPAAAWREFLVTEHHTNQGRMVRTADWKYVRYKDDPIEQLFDMRNDPWETKNLYDDPKYADIIQNHRKLLQDWESRVIAAPLRPLPPQARHAAKKKRQA